MLHLLFAVLAFADSSAYTSIYAAPNVAKSRSFHLAFGGATEGTTACSASPCTIYRQSDDEGNQDTVSLVSRASSGSYTVNITPGRCSAPPTCTTMMSGTIAKAWVSAGVPTNTALPLTLTVGTASLVNGALTYSVVDGGVAMLCNCLK